MSNVDCERGRDGGSKRSKPNGAEVGCGGHHHHRTVKSAEEQAESVALSFGQHVRGDAEQEEGLEVKVFAGDACREVC